MKRALIRSTLAALALGATLHAPLAQAGVHCTERVSMAILHSNGGIFFQTDNTCSNGWCQINWGTPEKNKNALAMMLSAKLADRPLTFYWPTLDNCSAKNAVYGSPDYMVLY
ncbi:hypothetical protein [Mitsuaria sp. GD03876]|uniref:hypothetical protein n=1 Tax=Mitsuaria sp. GD03876 TaxID=2975399 RepID=UPI00244920B9|nr:hypothetical protein [Mitsuaria sp. GD03876]MDH0867074.1 hypothetical protein [Mitsuaria sp. GD03876]